jgi:hypothetical protein
MEAPQPAIGAADRVIQVHAVALSTASFSVASATLS